MSTDTLPQLALDTAEEPPPRRRWLVVVLVLLLVVAGLAARGLWPERKADIRSGTTLVTADGLAARYGIKVSMIAVVAAGGLIEFRYQVVDPDKADPLRHDVGLLPAMVVEDSGVTLALSSTPGHHSSETTLGGTYFILFPNARNAIRRGSLVTVVIGEVRLEHIVAQG